VSIGAHHGSGTDTDRGLSSSEKILQRLRRIPVVDGHYPLAAQLSIRRPVLGFRHQNRQDAIFLPAPESG
jgi:hypothetical protein